MNKLKYQGICWDFPDFKLLNKEKKIIEPDKMFGY